MTFFFILREMLDSQALDTRAQIFPEVFQEREKYVYTTVTENVFLGVIIVGMLEFPVTSYFYVTTSSFLL